MIHCDPDKRPRPEELFVSFQVEESTKGLDDQGSFQQTTAVLSATQTVAGKVVEGK